MFFYLSPKIRSVLLPRASLFCYRFCYRDNHIRALFLIGRVAIRVEKVRDLLITKARAEALAFAIISGVGPEIESGLITLVGRNVQLQAVRLAMPAFHRPPDVTRLHISAAHHFTCAVRTYSLLNYKQYERRTIRCDAAVRNRGWCVSTANRRWHT